MPAKIFINYRRDDVPGDARGVRDGLAAKFGKPNVFMDVDNLLAGQRFDVKLAEALDACDVLIAIIGPRWMDLLQARAASGERDYVREEIAAALKRKIAVIPVRVAREDAMPALPRGDDLPVDIRDLVLFHKHDVAHERFGRDINDLNASIVALRGGALPEPAQRNRWPLLVWTTAAAVAVGLGATQFLGTPSILKPATAPASVTVAPSIPTIVERERAEEFERLKAAVINAERDRKIAEAEAAKLALFGPNVVRP